MPETRIERLVFVLGLCVIALLVAYSVREASLTRRAAAGQTVPTRPATTPTVPARTQPAATVSSTPTTAAAAVSSPSPKPRVTLSLEARSADSWFEVRSGSASGRVLFSGILPQGARRVFHGARLWARFGGAANLDARLNGAPLRLPGGTYDAIVTRGGLQRARSQPGRGLRTRAIRGTMGRGSEWEAATA